jgi:hypothetical protein
MKKMGINIPNECRIETVVENHDWIGDQTDGFAKADGTIICNVGSGEVARSVYRIVSYGHNESAIGKFKKNLLHSSDVEEVGRD